MSEANNLAEWLTRHQQPIPDHIEKVITTPHSHECDVRRPLWLIWKQTRFARTGVLDFPRLDSVCDSEESARYHYHAARDGSSEDTVSVERIPANHRFASSLGDWQFEAHKSQWKARAEYNKRVGD